MKPSNTNAPSGAFLTQVREVLELEQITREELSRELPCHFGKGGSISLSSLNRILRPNYEGGVSGTTLMALQSWLRSKQPKKGK